MMQLRIIQYTQWCNFSDVVQLTGKRTNGAILVDGKQVQRVIRNYSLPQGGPQEMIRNLCQP
jgi:hypothetical protein